MNLDDFYSSTSPEMAKEIWGELAHFHWAVPSETNDPFDQAVIDLFPYIQQNSKVLDCGSGWGGPGRLLQQHLNCDVRGVTISQTQAAYSNQFFPTDHADLHDYVPNQHYDLAMFFESYYHLADAPKVLSNLTNVDSILIKDYSSPNNLTSPIWNGTCRSEETYRQELENAGFKVQTFINLEGEHWQPTIDLWYKKLKGKTINQLPPLLRYAYEVCIYYYNMPVKDLPVKHCIVYATKLT